MQKTYSQILGELLKIPCIDTHEHLRFVHMINFDTLLEEPEKFQVDLRKVISGLYMESVLNGAAAGAGLANLDDRKSLLQALRLCANTASYRCAVEIPLRDLYDFDANDLDEDSWDSLEAKIAERYKDGPWVWMQQVFRRANIEKALKINVSPSYYEQTLATLSPADLRIEQELLVGVGATDFFVLHKPDPTEQALSQKSYQSLAEKYGVCLDDLDGFLALIDKTIAHYRSLGACGLKSTAAYERTSHIDNVTAEEARKYYKQPNRELSAEELKRFSDFTWIEVSRAAGRHDLPLQIHTGVMWTTGHLLADANPALMRGLLNNPELAQTKFVLLHTGYPYARESVHLAWDLPNVWIDFVWLPTIGIEAGANVLGEFLDWVPANKFTLGGDFKLPEGVYGAMRQSIEVLALVLARKVDQGFWSMSQAVGIGRMVLRDNALQLYNLPN